MHLHKLIALLSVLLFGYGANAQWSAMTLSEALVLSEGEYRTMPENFRSFHSDENFKALASGQIVLPTITGEMRRFTLKENKIMQDGLAERYPHIKTFKGFASDGAIAYIDITGKGLHALIIDGDNRTYIDPMRYGNGEYIVYDSKAYNTEEISQISHSFSCATEGLGDDLIPEGQELKTGVQLRSTNVPVTLRSYILAIATSGEYCVYHGGSKTDAMDAVTTAINRVNSVMNIDMAVNIILHENTDELFYCDGNLDPYTNGDTGAMIDENVTAIRSKIRGDSYDFGHVLCTNGGGLAQLGSICGEAKERGVSCWSNPIGDPFHVAVVSHEMGHMFGAPHIFNGQGGSCGSNRSQATPFEPGSGTTIMSYAGLCGSDNIINTSDPYYNNGSLQRMYTFFNQGGGSICSENTITNNTTPEIINLPKNNLTIPISTPIELSAEAIDADGDDMTYNWEQQDDGVQGPLGEMSLQGPLFRSVLPNDNPTRTIPNTPNLIRNRTSRSEVLPTISRDFTFYFTVRDNNSEAGGVVWDFIKFKSTDSAGPFLVNSFNDRGLSLTAGDAMTIEWDVANTDNDIVKCTSVDILYSTDGGNTFDNYIAQAIPNTGSSEIFLPNVITSDFRIKIQGHDHIFFDINNQDVELIENTRSTIISEVFPRIASTCVPNNLLYTIRAEDVNDYEGGLNIQLIGDLPDGLNAELTRDNIVGGESVDIIISADARVSNSAFELIVEMSNDSILIERTISGSFVGTDVSDQSLDEPANGASGMKLNFPFEWTASSAAIQYDFQLSDTPDFTNILFESTGIVDATVTPDINLLENTVYYWRIKPLVSPCGYQDFSEIYSFKTATVSCNTINSGDVPLSISRTEAATYNSILEVNSDFTIEDLNIAELRGIHSNTANLRFSLESPAGTVVELIRQKCNLRENFNIKLDDDVASQIPCPMTSGRAHTPEEMLSAFNGERSQGTWTLIVQDVTSLNGGNLQAWGIEFCGALPTVDPFIVNNRTIDVDALTTKVIPTTLLEVGDGSSSENELIFTLSSNVKYGTLKLNGTALSPGGQFTQADISSGSLSYTSERTDQERDEFFFNVENSQNGWLGGQKFVIDIDLSVSNEIIPNIANDLILAPNPAQELISISSSELLFTDRPVQVYTVSGQKIEITAQLTKNQIEMNVTTLSPGLYLARVWTDKGSATLKFIKD